jgi:exosortase E/protease (VPEID-CTERM system)
MIHESAHFSGSFPRLDVPRARILARALLSGLPCRCVALALLFILEWKFALSGLHDISNLQRKSGLTGLVGDLLQWRSPPYGSVASAICRAVIAFAALFLTFGFIGARSAFQRVSGKLVGISVSWRPLAGHICSMFVFCALSYLLFGHTGADPQADLIAAAWVAIGILALSLAAFAVVPLRLCLELLNDTAHVFGFAFFGGLAAAFLVGDLAQSYWKSGIGLTFSLVEALLRPIIPELITDPTQMVIGSPSFHVTIFPACSGFEGAGLMLVFSVSWLWFFRRECRFPRALLLIPAGVFLIWFLNGVRIAALILIGNAGAPDVAMGGFHSQAGWIAFNAIALGFSLASRRVSWLTVQGPHIHSVEDRPAENPTAWYLTPFLAILAAAMVTRAATGGFEWLYPLRFFAAAIALWYFRHKYAGLDWRIGWAAPIAGFAVFAIWLGLDRMTGANADDAIGVRLASLSTSMRVTWIVFRTLAATITVPIAEELAFRGFLLRRLISPDFEKVGCRSFTFLSVLGSSIAFGMLQGDRWRAGTIAGVIYALTFRQYGRIGDAVVAHAITNGLLAAWVLHSSAWQLW